MMSSPAIVVVHNRYLHAGGEDTVFEREAALLEAHGHTVVRVEVSNEQVAELSPAGLTRSLLWNGPMVRRVAEAVANSGAAIAHFHNTFPLVSPGAYYGARRAGAAVVQTLHNFRLVCPGGLLMRDGKPCEECVGTALALPGIRHGCYRGSRLQSAGVAAMVATHRAAGTWRNQVDAYVALSDFSRQRFTAGGLPVEKIHVRPNFLQADPGPGTHEGHHVLFVGRLTAQKGLGTLIQAWRDLGHRIPLRVIGEGDMRPSDFGAVPGVEWVGQVSEARVLSEMKAARALVLPSISYENFPMTIVEAFATGLPVLASRIGSLPEIVRDGRTGFTFDPASPAGLMEVVERAWTDPAHLSRLGKEARREYERSYSAEPAYASLMAIYDAASRTFAASGVSRRDPPDPA